MVKCCWCGKEEKYSRKDIKYSCVSCQVFTHIGMEIVNAVQKNIPLNAIDTEPVNMEQIKSCIEGMMYTNRLMDKNEKKYNINKNSTGVTSADSSQG